MSKKVWWILVGVSLGLLALLTACQGAAGATGPAGPTGAPGPQGVAGPPGPLPPVTERQLNASVSVSKPANGTHFVAGEKAVVAISLEDQVGKALTKEDLSTLALYMYGPQETTETVSAVKLLNASTDRSKTPHHYIDLLKSDGVQIKGNGVEYTLQPVTDEKPGTYIVTVRAEVKGNPASQKFLIYSVQIGTATVEKQIVEKEKCATCHLGADNGQFYFHHVDPGRSPYGSPSIDSMPVTTCKSCHNNNGYAGYNGLPGAPAGTDPNTTRVPDPIVRRVHGVHMGEGLRHVFDSDPKTGDFRDYIEVVFPADVKNCAKCHVDDRWKTKPSQLACGACHDNIWFGTAAQIPPEMAAHNMELHPGGPQANDSACATCHQPDVKSVAPSISEAHKVSPPAFKNVVELAITAPRNGKFYVSGEKPKLTITIKDAATGTIINPTTIAEPKVSTNVTSSEWRRANLFVSGPRVGTVPVLTTAAAHVDPTHSYANNDFRVRTVAANEDPQITRSATAITYQLDDVKDLKPGTYTAFVEIMPSAPLGAIGLINFKVGTDKEETKVATNCTSCHEDTRMHASYFAVPFNPDYCKNCHDYKRQMPGKTTWTASNSGFGAAPLARRIHGVHFGEYLDKPKEVHATVDYSGVIFPQDVRNCTKCHSSDTTGTWKTEPSRLACNACHDTDSAIAHTSLMTQDPTPTDPWSGDEIETCDTCHGAGRDFSPDKVHNISNPYKPPYPREPEK